MVPESALQDGDSSGSIEVDHAGSTDFIEIEPHIVTDDMVDAEVEFCSALRGWDPWGEPTQELLNAMQKAMAFNGSMPTNTSCVARQAAVRQLALEKTAMRFIPDTLHT